LTFLYLSNIGNFLADCFRLFYKRVCCDVLCCEKCERKRKRLRLKLRRRREILAAAARQHNFRFGEIATVDMEPGRDPPPRFLVEIPELTQPLVVNASSFGCGHSSSSWTTVSVSSAAAVNEGGAGKEMAAPLALLGARETDIIRDGTSATSDDERTTTDDGYAIRETDIIDDDDDDDDPTSFREQNCRLSVGNTKMAPLSVDTKTAQQASRRRRLQRCLSDTKLDALTANDAQKHVADIASSNRAAAARAPVSSVLRRSASVKARPTGCLLLLLILLLPLT